MSAPTARVTVICSDPRNHIWPLLCKWCFDNNAALFTSPLEADGGDLLLLVSCTDIIVPEIRAKYACTLVIHESDLPQGRGWSPFAWQVLEGKDDIVVSLLEAAHPADCGDILVKRLIEIESHELCDEITKRDAVRIGIMDWAVENFRISPRTPQEGEASYYSRRHPRHSRIDPERSLVEQFDLIRICEPRFPAFFDLRGHRYELTVRKISGEGNLR
jgi:methionyl-tRNA formyltransferase